MSVSNFFMCAMPAPLRSVLHTRTPAATPVSTNLNRPMSRMLTVRFAAELLLKDSTVTTHAPAPYLSRRRPVPLDTHPEA